MARMKGEHARVTGLKELEAAIAALPDKLVKKELRAANRASANIIRRESKANAKARTSKNTGRLIGGFAQRQRTYQMKRIMTVIHARAPHAHLLEFGTQPRYQPNGKYVGEGPALRFMTDAYNDKKGEAAKLFKQRALEGLERQANALGKKSKGRR